jgi:hypothetical protein
VTVLFSPSDKARIIPLLRMLREIGVVARGYCIRPDWENVPDRELSRLIFDSTHFFILCSTESLKSSWIAFVVGFSLGNERPALLFRTLQDVRLPRYLAAFPTTDSLDIARTYFLKEKHEWHEERRQQEAKRLLLDAGISFNADSFAQCVSDGDLTSIKLFIAAGLDPNLSDKNGIPLLSTAIRCRRRQIVEFLVDRDADINAVSADRGYSALMEAVRLGDRDLALLLIDRGADLEIHSKDGQTSLMLSVGHGNVEMTKLLVDSGADPDTCDALGFSARKYANMLGNNEIRMLLAS